MCEGKDLSSEDLISLYKEQWKQIRHLDLLDIRLLTLLPIVTAIITIAIKIISSKITQNTEDGFLPSILSSLFFSCSVIILGISITGCYTTLRNWLCYMRRFSILTALEKELKLVEKNIVGKSMQFNPPSNLKAFLWKFIQSIRFPLALFYSCMGGLVYFIYIGEVSWFPIICFVIISLGILAICIAITYRSYKKEFLNVTEPAVAV